MEIAIESDPDIEAALAWVERTGGPGLDRRLAIAKAHFDAACVPTGRSMVWPSPWDLLPSSDQVAGMLLQAHALVRDRRYFDAYLASRFIPFFKLIGSALPDLAHVDGSAERLEHLLDPRTDHSEGTLLELGVAARYLREGYDLRFVPTQSQRTPDIEIVDVPGTFIECKRLKPGNFERAENTAVRQLFESACQVIERRRGAVVMELVFVGPINAVPEDYLAGKVSAALDCKLALPFGYTWSDEHARGKITPANLAAVRDDTRDSYLLAGPKLIRLLTGGDTQGNELWAVRGKHYREDPRYLDDLSAAAVLTWDVVDPASVTARARHVRSKLAEIDQQLADAKVGIAHIVVDAERDAIASDLRRARNRDAIEGFRFGSRAAFVHCHYLLNRTVESVSWTIDETVDSWKRMDGEVLADARLFIDGDDLGEVAGWHQSPP